ncbi:hypothetical protein [Bryobacter aggregatus]|uniref:hypothetical protein n=1 Tax=Bryobacter aggregatus TaxID=360054 RepID=UPI00068C6722|nr:hypothetical protein [Bryobacter aggregatus]
MTYFRRFCCILFTISAFAADYQLCFLKDGPNSGKLSPERSKQLQTSHLQHIREMWKSGALESAGPVSGLPGVRGILLFNRPAQAATKLAAADPKVVAGDLRAECTSWTAPAGIGKAYREAAARPGFAEKAANKVGLLMKIATPIRGLGSVSVAGVLGSGEYRYFAVLDNDQIEAVQRKFSGETVFLWFHDDRVWDGLTP